MAISITHQLEGMSREYFKDDGLFPRARPIYVKRQEILIRPI
jgi:hypothetical protein